MNFAGTQMSMVLFAIIMFELVMLFFQIIYFLERPSDRKRFWYLLLLIFLLFYNIAGGLFPDPNIPIPIVIQTIIAYLAGFTMSVYFVIYFYKGFDLTRLKFFATYGILLFLVIPFVFLFAVPYWITNNLEFSRKLTVVIPFLYCIAFIYYTGKTLFEKLGETERGSNDYREASLQIAPAFIALVFWGALPVITFFGDFQVLEHSVTNAGFLFLSLTYIRSSIIRSKKEYDRLLFSERTLQKMTNDLKAKVEMELEAIENERNRIAYDIHDEVIGNLTTAIIEIDVLQLQEVSVSHQGKESLKNMEAKLNMSVGALREIIYGLCSKSVLSSDFNSIVSELCSRYDSINGVKINFRANDQAFELTMKQKQHLFRIIQELLTNSIKHSDAWTINVYIIWSMDSLELKYSDNGKGLESLTSNSNHSAYGLNGIALRAQSIMATHQFLTPESGMGFSLTFSQEV